MASSSLSLLVYLSPPPTGNSINIRSGHSFYRIIVLAWSSWVIPLYVTPIVELYFYRLRKLCDSEVDMERGESCHLAVLKLSDNGTVH